MCTWLLGVPGGAAGKCYLHGTAGGAWGEQGIDSKHGFWGCLGGHQGISSKHGRTARLASGWSPGVKATALGRGQNGKPPLTSACPLPAAASHFYPVPLPPHLDSGLMPNRQFGCRPSCTQSCCTNAEWADQRPSMVCHHCLTHTHHALSAVILTADALPPQAPPAAVLTADNGSLKVLDPAQTVLESKSTILNWVYFNVTLYWK